MIFVIMCSNSLNDIIFSQYAGADPGFSFRGAHKVMCQHAHYEHGTELTFGRGPGPA